MFQGGRVKAQAWNLTELRQFWKDESSQIVLCANPSETYP